MKVCPGNNGAEATGDAPSGVSPRALARLPPLLLPIKELSYRDSIFTSNESFKYQVKCDIYILLIVKHYI